MNVFSSEMSQQTDRTYELQLLMSAILVFGSLQDIYICFNKARIGNTVKIDSREL